MIFNKTVILAKNEPTYSAYPTKKRKPLENLNSSSISTVDKNLKNIDSGAANQSTSLAAAALHTSTSH